MLVINVTIGKMNVSFVLSVARYYKKKYCESFKINFSKNGKIISY